MIGVQFMSRSILLMVSMCVLSLSGGKSWAQPPTNSVKWATGSPVVASGDAGNSISASGTYTTEAGYSPLGNAVLYAVPTGGGAFNQAAGAIDTKNQKWGPAQITKLVSGQYTVYAVIVFQDGNGKQVTVSSPTSIVTIP